MFKKKIFWTNLIEHSMDNEFIIKMYRQNWNFLCKKNLWSEEIIPWKCKQEKKEE